MMTNRQSRTTFVIVLIVLAILFLLVTVFGPSRALAQEVEIVPVELDREWFFERECPLNDSRVSGVGIVNFAGVQPGEPTGTLFSGEYMNLGEDYSFLDQQWQPVGLVSFSYGQKPNVEQRFATVMMNRDGRVVYLLSTALPQKSEDIDRYDCGAYLVFIPNQSAIGL